MKHKTKVWLAWVATILVLLVAWTMTMGRADGSATTRTWTASYNSALSLREAAVPLQAYPVGARMRLTYHGKSLVVHSISGGCMCFDISDEAMRYLAGSTSIGIIRVKVTKLGW